jgi:hypothetical protein
LRREALFLGARIEVAEASSIMSTKIEVMCARGHIEIVSLAGEVSGVEVSICIVAENPCSACGASLTAPRGRYEKQPDGVLFRVGDIDERQ